jgi:hypothetical protein
MADGAVIRKVVDPDQGKVRQVRSLFLVIAAFSGRFRVFSVAAVPDCDWLSDTCFIGSH